MAVLVGVDPGATTGVCIVEECSAQADDFQVVSALQIPWEERLSFFQALFSGTSVYAINEPRLPEVVVIEQFKLRGDAAFHQVGSDFPSVRIIGIIEAMVFVYKEVVGNSPLLVYQPNADIHRVQILPQHEAKFVGLKHAADAYRHLRYYMLTTHKG